MGEVEYATAIRPLYGSISECGDAGKIIRNGNRYFIALIDVLGHGSKARKVAVQAEEYLDAHSGEDLLDIMNGLHHCLIYGRGAVVALCSFDAGTAVLRYTGIGNITVKIVGSESAKLVSRDGIVGYGTIRPQLSETRLKPGDTLLLYSDGIRTHFDLLECPGLFFQSAEKIANTILEKFGKMNDDASCIVMKYLN
jgi:serine phosphatase RsbU (regulator of sigma subunit)